MYRRAAIEVYYSTGDSLETADKLVLIEGDKFHVPVRLRHQMVTSLRTQNSLSSLLNTLTLIVYD